MKIKTLGQVQSERRVGKTINAQQKLKGRPGDGGISVSTVGTENFKKQRRNILDKASGDTIELNRKSQENLK